MANAVAAQPGTVVTARVAFAAVDGFSATTGSSVQTTGAGYVAGIPDDYRSDFPAALRTLAGVDTGVLLAQQTAANLRAGVADTVTVSIAGKTLEFRVDGIVDLPQADSSFHEVGGPPQSQPIAPPDNIVLVPAGVFDRLVVPAARAAKPRRSATRSTPSAPTSSP